MGFEAVLRGKPCFVFGDAPYLGCEGVSKVSTLEDATKAFQELQSIDFKIDKEKVMEYVKMAIGSTLHCKTNTDSTCCICLECVKKYEKGRFVPRCVFCK